MEREINSVRKMKRAFAAVILLLFMFMGLITACSMPQSDETAAKASDTQSEVTGRPEAGAVAEVGVNDENGLPDNGDEQGAGNAADIREKHVSNVNEFLDAIGSDTIIIMEDGNYDLNKADSYGVKGNSYCAWEDGFEDNYELVIRNVSNLTIQGASTENTLIETNSPWTNVIRFSGCSNVTLRDFTAGHLKEINACSAGVLEFIKCREIRIERCGLFGCGTVGVTANNCEKIQMIDSSVYECSLAGSIFRYSEDVSLNNCVFEDIRDLTGTDTLGMLLFIGSKNVDITECEIRNSDVTSLLCIDSCSNVRFISNTVSRNRFSEAMFDGAMFPIIVDGCEFSDNDAAVWFRGIIGAVDRDGKALTEMRMRDMKYESGISADF